jgi:hypothetical protein
VLELHCTPARCEGQRKGRSKDPHIYCECWLSEATAGVIFISVNIQQTYVPPDRIHLNGGKQTRPAGSIRCSRSHTLPGWSPEHGKDLGSGLVLQEGAS